MEKVFIPPVVGRVVWFWPHHGGSESRQSQPYAAQVAFVRDDGEINVGYLDQSGVHCNAVAVPLIQEGEEPPAEGYYCEWMPYQKGQARRDEAETVG